jgi:hypothetical protein
MYTYSLGNIEKLTQKWEQAEQEQASNCNHLSNAPSKSRNKVGTKSEQSRNSNNICQEEDCLNRIDFNGLCAECAILKWHMYCQNGDRLPIPLHWREPFTLEALSDLQTLAEEMTHWVRQRDSTLKVVLPEELDHFLCQSWKKPVVDNTIPPWLQ